MDEVRVSRLVSMDSLADPREVIDWYQLSITDEDGRAMAREYVTADALRCLVDELKSAGIVP